VPDEYYTKLQKQVYELINGALELPKDLMEKIEKFNAGETKDKKKILKGTDYWQKNRVHNIKDTFNSRGNLVNSYSRISIGAK
jgi:hypothetical protein